MFTSPERIARALPLLAVLAATALVASQVFAWLGVERAADATRRGEAETLLHALVGRLGTDGAAVDEAQLEDFLEIHRDAGLRYVAVETEHARFEVGEARLLDGPGEEVEVGEDRVRMSRHPVPPPPEGFGPDGMGPDGMGPDGMRREGPTLDGVGPQSRYYSPRSEGALGRDGPPPFGPPPFRNHIRALTVELEPQIAPMLQADALRTLLASGLGAALFFALAFALRRVSREREAAVRSAEHARGLAALGEMSGVLAHELRNPLASLKGHAQLLVEQLGEGRPRTKAELVVREAFRLEEISNNLLEFVRSGDLKRTPNELHTIAADAIATFDASEVTIVLEGSARAAVDAARLHQVLVNVLDNAAQVAGDEPIEVVIDSTSRRATLIVRDHGPGIPEDQLVSIFEPFKTSRTRGTGLGLSIAKRIVEAHGGRIWAANHVDGGAEITIELPVKES